MSWEAHRWTAKSPSELFHVFGPHGTDSLVREALNACWRELPDDSRNFAAARKAADELFGRNVAVWRAIKKPDPAAFFDHLLHTASDGFMRQAFVLCWMMLPRTGGRKLSDVIKVVTAIYDRLMDAWEQDNVTFMKGPSAKKRTPAAAKRKTAPSAKNAKATRQKPKARVVAKR
jgi:hypothetical protein